MREMNGKGWLVLVNEENKREMNKSYRRGSAIVGKLKALAFPSKEAIRCFVQNKGVS